METTQIFLDKHLADTARLYAEQRGSNLTELIESYLLQLTQKKKTDRAEVPDVVLSLLGAGEPVEEDDLNGRKAYYEHLKEKYK